jgi:hypothetical protein
VREPGDLKVRFVCDRFAFMFYFDYEMLHVVLGWWCNGMLIRDNRRNVRRVICFTE